LAADRCDVRGAGGNLLPHVALSAIQAQHLMPAWGLSAAEGGLMASGYAFGYMLAVPVLTTLTDRIDARVVLLCGSIVSGLATIAFGFFAQGFWSATAIWSLAGVGFAGAYMPGLKALTDRLPAATRRGRSRSTLPASPSGLAFHS
jgi:sugar phosphate permease